MRIPVSCFIIAVNEASRIHRTIASVRDWVDEVVVIDSGSTDGTQEIAMEMGARVVFNTWPGYGPQKRFGEALCKNDWLLNLDADEVVTPELREEILALFSRGEPPHQAYELSVIELLPGESTPSRFAHRVPCVRLYHRAHGRYAESLVHDRVEMKPGASVSKLAAIVEHFSVQSVTISIEKINRYSSMQADDMLARKRTPLFLNIRLFLEFPFAFLKAYFFRKHILRGRYGYIMAVNYAFSRYARLAKLVEKKLLERRKS